MVSFLKSVREDVAAVFESDPAALIRFETVATPACTPCGRIT